MIMTFLPAATDATADSTHTTTVLKLAVAVAAADAASTYKPITFKSFTAAAADAAAPADS